MLESDTDCVLYQQSQPCVRWRALSTRVACAVQRALIAFSPIDYWPDGTCAILSGLGTDARLSRIATQFSSVRYKQHVFLFGSVGSPFSSRVLVPFRACTCKRHVLLTCAPF